MAFQALHDAILRFLTGGAAVWLVGFGTTMFGILASMRLVAFGRKMVAAGGSMFAYEFFEELIPIAAGFTILSYWSVGAGRSVPGEFVNAVSYVVNLVNTASGANVTQQIAQWQSQMEPPTFVSSIVGILIYVAISVLCWMMEAVGFVAGAIAMVTTAICIVGGPLAIATCRSRNFDYLFRGWLRATICYGTMPITVSIIAGIMANFTVTVLTQVPHVAIDDYVGQSTFIILVLATGFICTAISPVIHAHILSGSSGAGGGLVGSMTGAIVGRISR
jgi:hypothetical protein